MQQKVREHAGNSNRHGAAPPPPCYFAAGPGHAVGVIPDIGNVMHLNPVKRQ